MKSKISRSKIQVLVSHFKDDLKAEFFQNSMSNLMVRLPGQGLQQDWYVEDPRVTDLMTLILYERQYDPLNAVEFSLLMSLIREECRDGERRYSEDELAAIEKDPVIQGICCLMNEQESFEGRTAELLFHLRIFQKQNKIKLQPEVPVLTNVFSRALKGLIGIQVKQPEDVFPLIAKRTQKRAGLVMLLLAAAKAMGGDVDPDFVNGFNFGPRD